MKKSILFLIVSFLLLLTSCRFKSPNEIINTPGVVPLDAYPGPDSAYPRPIAPTKDPNRSLPQLVPFKIEKPIHAGSIEVKGSGPAGVPIILADITFNGDILSQGVIGQDGKFVLTLTIPLEANHRIGIALNDFKNTSWDSSDFLDQGFFGDEFQQVPTIGFFYDTYLVIP